MAEQPPANQDAGIPKKDDQISGVDERRYDEEPGSKETGPRNGHDDGHREQPQPDSQTKQPPTCPARAQRQRAHPEQ